MDRNKGENFQLGYLQVTLETGQLLALLIGTF
jgi:hypothetical protein